MLGLVLQQTDFRAKFFATTGTRTLEWRFFGVRALVLLQFVICAKRFAALLAYFGFPL